MFLRESQSQRKKTQYTHRYSIRTCVICMRYTQICCAEDVQFKDGVKICGVGMEWCMVWYESRVHTRTHARTHAHTPRLSLTDIHLAHHPSRLSLRYKHHLPLTAHRHIQHTSLTTHAHTHTHNTHTHTHTHTNARTRARARTHTHTTQNTPRGGRCNRSKSKRCDGRQ